METLKLDLLEDATRQNIRAQLYALLDQDAVASIEETVAPLATSGGHCHDVADVRAAIDGMGLADKPAADAKAVYAILNQAEATVHGCSPDETHFHEVGNHEAIANVLEVCLAIDALQPERIVATPVQAGCGKVQCAHGLLDIPAPATAAILALGIPVVAEKREGEWCTPTSAAIIKHFVVEFAE